MSSLNKPLLVFIAISLTASLSYAQGIKGLNTDNVLKTESFNYQQKCVHHDNFHREVTRLDKWKIGENYGSKVTYYSPRKDYATIDDGFRIKTVVEETGDEKYPHKIVSGYLTNDQNVKVEKAFRFITTSSSLKDNFFIETSVPTVGNYAEVVCNYYDDNNYDAFEITSEKKNKAVLRYKSIKAGKENVSDLYKITYAAKSVWIAYLGKQLRLYLDGHDITESIIDDAKQVIVSFIIEKSRPIGIMVSRQHSYEYRVFDVFSIDRLRRIEVAKVIANNGIPDKWHTSVTKDYSYRFLPTLVVDGVGDKLPRTASKYPKNAMFLNITDGKVYASDGSGWIDAERRVDEYGMILDTRRKRIYTYDGDRLIKQGKGNLNGFPAYVQRFELRANDVNNTETAHCEIAENNDFSINNYNLRKRRVSFKTFLPVSYLDDDNKLGGEALIQFQISTDAGKTRQPLFTIASEVVGKNKVRYHLNRRYISTRPAPKDARWNEDIIRDDDVDLGKAKFGVWEQWDVYVKEGYMQEHCPLLVVKRNGKEVYRSTLPNTYNIMSGSYIRYGVYKSIYRYDDSKRKRIVYIGDFECDI